MLLGRLEAAALMGLILLTGALLVGNISEAEADPADGAATFTTVTLSQQKIYEGENVTLNFAVKNLNSSETQFYIRIYRYSQLVLDGKSNPFQCNGGEETERIIVELGGWTGPETYSLTVELRSTPSDTLHDTRQLALTVVELATGKWTSSISRIVWGLNETLPMKVNFTNIGNDEMEDAVVTVMSSDLKISPLSSGNLGAVSSGETKTLTFTLGSLNKKETKPGLYKVSFRLAFNDFRGVAHHQDETLELNVDKMKPKILLSSTPPNPKYGDPVKIQAELSDLNRKPLANEPLIFQVGSTVGQNQTTPQGVATYVYPAGLDSGNHSVKATYGGSEYYLNVSETFLVRVEPLATSISIDPPKTMNTTVPATVNITLLDERSRPVPNQTLKFTVTSKSGEISQTGQTDPEGRTGLTLNMNRSGEALLDVTFTGSTNYLKSSNSSRLSISPASTRMTVHSNPTVLIFGNSVDLELSLRSLLNTPVENVRVTILADEKPVTSVLTDSGGYAKTNLSLEPTLLLKRTKIQAVFDGDERFAQSTAEAEIISVNPAFLAALAAVAAGGVASSLLLVLRWRRLHEERAPLAKTKPVSKAQKVEPKTPEPLSPLDERIYSYIVDHSGVISWSQASKDLGVTVEQLKESTQRLRGAGRLMPSHEE